VAEVLSEGLVKRPDGGLDITFDRRLAATHGLPALAAILDGLRDGMAASGPDGPLKERLVGLVENVRTGLAGEPPPPRATQGTPAPGPDAPSTATVGAEPPASPPPEEPAASQAARPPAQPFVPDPRAVLEGLFARATSGGQAPAEGEAPSAPSGLTAPAPSASSGLAGAESAAPASRPTVSFDLAGILSGLLASVASPRPRPASEGEP
jgi:hypothetical protein